MKFPKIFVDLDGVLADFDGGYPRLFGKNHKELTDEEMWCDIIAHGSFFEQLDPLPMSLNFIDVLVDILALDTIILTACPKDDYTNAAISKRKWVRSIIDHDLLVLPMLGGVNKALFMHAPGDILVDDFEANIEAWEKAGGTGILHKGNFEDTLALVLETLNKRDLLKAALKNGYSLTH